MDYFKKLQECTCIGDAQPLLKSMKAGPAIRELIESGIMLKGSPDKNTQHFGNRLLMSAVREAEEDEEKKEKEANGFVNPDQTKGDKDVEKKVTEEQITHPRDSEGSTDSTEPYPQEGGNAPNTDIESMQTASGQDQMKEGFPMGIAGVDPNVAKEMGLNNQQLPPMNTSQNLRQMQYAISEAIKPFRIVLAKHQEALVALGKQMQETKTRYGAMKLDVASVKANAPAREIRESVTDSAFFENGIPYPKQVWPKMNLESTRREIADLDKNLRTTGSQPYQ